METPQNVVPMPAEQRAELKRLAEAATSGPWCTNGFASVLTVAETKPVYDWSKPLGGGKYPLTYHESWPIAHLDDGEYIENPKGREDAAYIAAVSPDVALAILAYVEALEAEAAELAGQRDAFALLADAELARETGPPGGFTLLTWCLRYGSDNDLDYIFDKLSRRCKAGKALTERAEQAEAAAATARGELAEQEAEKLALVNEIEAYKLVHQGMQTKWHAILRQVIAPLPEFEEAVKSGKAMQRAGFTPAASILNCQKDCAVCAATLAPAPPQEGEAAEPMLTQGSVNNLARLDYWHYQHGSEKPQVDGRGWAFPNNPDTPTGWNVYIGPPLEYIGKQGLLCVGEIKQGEPSFFSLDDDEREVIGTYEFTGLPVYEGDDYVTDAEGCYLTREEADELAQEADNEPPALPLEGKAAPATYEEYLATAEKSGMLSTAHIETWDRLSRAGQRQLIEHAQNWTQSVDAEGRPLEFREGGYWNE